MAFPGSGRVAFPALPTGPSIIAFPESSFDGGIAWPRHMFVHQGRAVAVIAGIEHGGRPGIGLQDSRRAGSQGRRLCQRKHVQSVRRICGLAALVSLCLGKCVALPRARCSTYRESFRRLSRTRLRWAGSIAIHNDNPSSCRQQSLQAPELVVVPPPECNFAALSEDCMGRRVDCIAHVQAATVSSIVFNRVQTALTVGGGL